MYCILFGKPLRQILIPSRTPLQVNCCITNFESMKPRSNKAKCIEIQLLWSINQFEFIYFLVHILELFIGTFQYAKHCFVCSNQRRVIKLYFWTLFKMHSFVQTMPFLNKEETTDKETGRKTNKTWWNGLFVFKREQLFWTLIF